MTMADGGIGQCTSKKCLSRPGRADNGQIVMGLDPARGGQAKDHRTFQASLAMEVDVLDDRAGAQFGRFQIPPHAPVLAFGELFVDQQPEALLEAQGLIRSLVALLGQAGGHGWQLEGVEPVDGLVVEQFVVPFFSCNNRGHGRCRGPGG